MSNTKFLPSEYKYISQFNDNPECIKAVQLALTHLDIEDESNVCLLRRLVYVASVAAQSTDDDVFICSMLHPLGDYKYEVLPTILSPLSHEVLKVVQALRETDDVQALYTRVSSLDDKYKAVVMARVMYRLASIELFEYDDAESIIDEATTFTSKLEVPLEVYVQFEVLLNHARRIFDELYATEILEDVNSFEEVQMTTEDMQVYINHKRLADELDIAHNDEVSLPGIGNVTYYAGAGFCDENGELVNLEHADAMDTLQEQTHNPKGTVNVLSDDYDYEVKLHAEVAKSLGVVFDRQMTYLGVFGKVVYSQGIGFFNQESQMVALKGSVFDKLMIKYGDGKDSTGNTNSTTDELLADTNESIDIDAIEVAEHHKLAQLMKIQHGYCTNILNVGKVTYDESKGFVSEDSKRVKLTDLVI